MTPVTVSPAARRGAPTTPVRPAPTASSRAAVRPLALAAALGAVALASPAARADEPAPGPVIDLPAGDNRPMRDLAPADGAGQVRLGERTVLGGYGELHYNWKKVEGADSEAQVDLHRLVLFVGHAFTDRIRFASEIEIEHALIGEDGPGEVAIEQAYVDWDLLDGERLTLRAGAILVPMGRINRWHEPPTFLGVERPNVDRNIIPSTWTEAGIGLVGRIGELVRWEAYLVSGLDPAGFSTSSGIRGGRLKVGEAIAKGWAFTGRLEVEPVLGLTAGLAGYGGRMGNNLGDRVDAAGEALELDVPVTGLSLDATFKRGGLELNGQIATFAIGGTAKMRRAVDEDGVAGGLDAPSRVLGGYLEAGFDVLSFLDTTDVQLLPFVRFERFDTAFDLAGRSRTGADRARGVTEIVLGAQLEPIPQLAFKANVILSNRGGSAKDETRFDAGVGFMF